MVFWKMSRGKDELQVKGKGNDDFSSTSICPLLGLIWDQHWKKADAIFLIDNDR